MNWDNFFRIEEPIKDAFLLLGLAIAILGIAKDNVGDLIGLVVAMFLIILAVLQLLRFLIKK